MKKYHLLSLAIAFTIVFGVGTLHAQTFDGSTGALVPGWYYSAEGNPLYYYANGAYYGYGSNTGYGRAYHQGHES